MRVHTTTLWDYPSQQHGDGEQGDKAYVGATPSHVIWNVLHRYSREGDVVVDPFCGSGTTLDVARELKREARGFDLNPTRPDIVRADARALPLEDGSAQVVFMDPPYGDHIDYSSDPRCIGKLSAYDPKYYQAMRGAFDEAFRVLKPGGVLAVYVCDYFETKKGLAPVGFGLFSLFTVRFIPVDIVSVVRRNKSLLKGNFHQAAERDNFFLRGFNYLFIARKPDEAPRRQPQRPRSAR